ncbi:MAG TPA: deoxyribodipyrimidine photo-lyase [Acidimicrobiales bacterium]|nr:deoxyribodipyrimidine photo-lyase [Acidimicrobiales bacterium]
MTSSRDGSGGTAVMWFRRDLRLSDHPALSAALSEFDRVVPLFVWDQALVRSSGANRLAFLAGCVSALDRSLGRQLVCRRGRPPEVVAEVAARCDARAVFLTGDFGPYGSTRDAEVADRLSEHGVECRVVDSPYAVPPGVLHSSSGGPFQVFTPFYRAWRDHGWADPSRRHRLDRVTTAGLDSDGRPDLADGAADLPEPGEEAAHRRLDQFLRSGADRYGDERNRPDLDTTSRLSAYLRFGCLHPRQVLARLDRRNPSHRTYESELCWREFYADVLHHRPDAAHRSYRPEWRAFQVDRGAVADRRFEVWTEGRTGYPIVDAGMRQLLAEGFVHNRVRMIVASFLVKDLHVDWSRGARWFMRHLVDGDLASNQINWQWVAGSGTDAAPFFRVFNPVTQGKKFDPDGDYVRRWVPELRHLGAGEIHEPWKAGRSLLDGGADPYPEPLVDHAAEREEALSRYNRLRR